MALMEMHPTVTPVELAWLSRDLHRQGELIALLESAPSTPWHEAGRAIAEGDFAAGVKLADRIGAPSVTAYARLRSAEELVGAAGIASAPEDLELALDFFQAAGAASYLARTKDLLADAS
jgi:hypothetical protein